MIHALEQQVLVLNRLWQAVNVCSVRRALTLLFEGHAQVVVRTQRRRLQDLHFSEWRELFAAARGTRTKPLGPSRSVSGCLGSSC